MNEKKDISMETKEEGLQEQVDYDIQDIVAQVEATSLIRLKSENKSAKARK